MVFDEYTNEYSKYEITSNKPDEYSISYKVGQGRYSNVFVGFTGEKNSKEEQIFDEFEKLVAKETNIYQRLNELKNAFKKHKNESTASFKKCIIKVLKPNKEIGFKREVFILKKLKHKNIVKLIDVVEDSNTSQRSLIFEYTSLFNTKMLFSSMNIEDVKIYSKQILQGLDYAHKNGIVHRDIKPNNLIINPLSKTLKIIDWGIADRVESCVSSKVGTKGYKAPELIFNLFYGCKVDVWAFGCVFGEMLFGTQLFKDGDDFGSIVSILGEEGLSEFLCKYRISFVREEASFNENSEGDLLNEINNKSIKKVMFSALAYDQYVRYTCDELLSTKYFRD
ncbi:putative casein kinase II subunit alpha like protein [Cucumispora dikerogammari]|nr:putative casein kinase II subunit alpha like protein [Cucumispora dikerogammari]